VMSTHHALLSPSPRVGEGLRRQTASCNRWHDRAQLRLWHTESINEDDAFERFSMHQEQAAKLTRVRLENQQLAGQRGFTQAKLQEAEKTIGLPMTPTEPEPAEETPATSEPRHGWWRRLLGE
jgi:hypothetical protein